MTESLNFTQFCVKYGYTSDHGITDHASLSPSGHCSFRTKMAQLKALDKRLRSNELAHYEYIEAIINDKIIDPSGEFVKEKILAERKRQQTEKINSEIQILNGHIKFIESLGRMAYTKSGKLKKSYQLAIGDYKNKIAELENKLVGA